MPLHYSVDGYSDKVGMSKFVMLDSFHDRLGRYTKILCENDRGMICSTWSWRGDRVHLPALVFLSGTHFRTLTSLLAPVQQHLTITSQA